MSDTVDIDKLTDEELGALLDSEELKCKVNSETGELNCATPEAIYKAIARLKNPPKRLVFNIVADPTPVAVTPDVGAGDTPAG
jgi:hypothetical protein